MPDNFLKITAKWLVALLALNYLTNYLILFLMQNNGLGTMSPYRNSWFSIVIPLISLFGYLLILGLGIRDLSRSNEHKISVGAVFGYFAIMVTIPILVNYGMLYYRSFSDENLARLFQDSSYSITILVGILTNVLQGIIVLTYASFWRIFRRAGEKGWHALIPIYNLVIMCDIIKKERSLVLLFFVPIINFIALATITNGMAKAFGRSTAFSVGLFFLPFIFFPILAFGENEYIYGEYEVVKDDLDLEDHLVE
jgi:hypothetical protein